VNRGRPVDGARVTSGRDTAAGAISNSDTHHVAALQHERAASTHVEAAAFWRRQQDDRRADLNARAARLERELAGLQHDWARLELEAESHERAAAGPEMTGSA
jgi:hypothetical protein